MPELKTLFIYHIIKASWPSSITHNIMHQSLRKKLENIIKKHTPQAHRTKNKENENEKHSSNTHGLAISINLILHNWSNSSDLNFNSLELLRLRWGQFLDSHCQRNCNDSFNYSNWFNILKIGVNNIILLFSIINLCLIGQLIGELFQILNCIMTLYIELFLLMIWD
jgi:hypothetical protein